VARYYGRYDYYDSYGFPPYVPQAVRRFQAQQALKKLTKAGKTLAPVSLNGRRKIATTFWGCAWCDNLERYSDFANRLPRGRSYVRNGSVVDLQVDAGVVTALVSGTDLYTVTIKVEPVPAKRWKALCQQCAGSIDSMIELLQGRLSTAVMQHICQRESGLFPSPREIHLSCSCPDWATMCKHVAAVLYGIGARLDAQPELLFRLRQVKAEDLVAQAGAVTAIQKTGSPGSRVMANEDLADVFGVELATLPQAQAAGKKRPAGRGRVAATVPKPGPGTSAQSPSIAKQKARGSTSANQKSGKSSSPTTRVAKRKARGSKTRRRRALTAAERKAVSERMRRYWQERRKAR